MADLNQTRDETRQQQYYINLNPKPQTLNGDRKMRK